MTKSAPRDWRDDKQAWEFVLRLLNHVTCQEAIERCAAFRPGRFWHFVNTRLIGEPPP